ncbi:hypothetical protein ACHAW6_007251 [Cyclotella cf. meneghiniana]
MRLWVLFTWLMQGWVVTHLHKGKCHIETMCEILEMWGRGIGIRLLEFCESCANEKNTRDFIGIVLCLGFTALWFLKNRDGKGPIAVNSNGMI